MPTGPGAMVGTCRPVQLRGKQTPRIFSDRVARSFVLFREHVRVAL